MKKKEYQKPTQTVIPIKMCILQDTSPDPNPEPTGGNAPRYDYSEN